MKSPTYTKLALSTLALAAISLTSCQHDDDGHVFSEMGNAVVGMQCNGNCPNVNQNASGWDRFVNAILHIGDDCNHTVSMHGNSGCNSNSCNSNHQAPVYTTPPQVVTAPAPVPVYRPEPAVYNEKPTVHPVVYTPAPVPVYRPEPVVCNMKPAPVVSKPMCDTPSRNTNVKKTKENKSRGWGFGKNKQQNDRGFVSNTPMPSNSCRN